METVVKSRLVTAFALVATGWSIITTVALILIAPSASDTLTVTIDNPWPQTPTQIGLVIVCIIGAILLVFSSTGSRILLAPVIWLVPLIYASLFVQISASSQIWYLPSLVLLVIASFIATLIYTAIHTNRAALAQLFVAALAAILGFYLVRWQFTNVLIAIARGTDGVSGADKTLLMAYGSAAVFTLLTLFLATGVASTFRNAISNSRRTVLLTGGCSGCLMLGSIIGLSFGGWLMIPSTLLMGVATLISNARDS